ncbi:UAA transporter [Auriscalpium vulgare]|uniref:UAA transporter n=1 Tax=Auriscalpium vulgare TaxID=40419 RepID=A0ACB8S9K9_9AGAM|nr:UAA transporter [Auriscalpium vulgare]
MAAQQNILLFGLSLSLLTDWFMTLGLVFGGCCSNAITLERITSQYPRSGTLITFAQFLVISLHGLPKFVTFTHGIPHLKPRRIPITPYLLQVGLFYLISLLNNAAFAYRIPMPVHIIFRSGGLVISMTMGWLILGKRYLPSQVLSVVVVTLGVLFTTLSATQGKASASQISQAPPLFTYLTGIAVLTVALLMSGLLGIVQDRTYTAYGRKQAAVKTAKTPEHSDPDEALPDVWEESMFYLHFLSLPMFVFVRHDLVAQTRHVLSDRSLSYSLPAAVLNVLPKATPFEFAMPSALPALLLNTSTQLICVAGVNRLTTRVAALTVTLVLVVRKAASLILSVLLFDGAPLDTRASLLLWSGAALVFAGTVGYTLSGRIKPKAKTE